VRQFQKEQKDIQVASVFFSILETSRKRAARKMLVKPIPIFYNKFNPRIIDKLMANLVFLRIFLMKLRPFLIFYFRKKNYVFHINVDLQNLFIL